MMETVTTTSTILASRDQVAADLEAELVILNLNAGVYYGLDLIGTRIWNLAKEGRNVGQIEQAILSEYDVEPDRCRRDLYQLPEKLADAGLVSIQNLPAVTA